MTAHSAQLTKMRLPDRAIMLKAVSKAKNPILVKRKKMFKLGLARDFFYSICDSLYLCSKTPLNPRLFTAFLPKRLYILLHIHHAFMIIFETSHTGLIMASLNVLGKLLPSSRTLSPFPLFLHWRSPLPFFVLFLFPASSISWATLAVSISFCNLDFI